MALHSTRSIGTRSSHSGGGRAAPRRLIREATLSLLALVLAGAASPARAWAENCVIDRSGSITLGGATIRIARVGRFEVSLRPRDPSPTITVRTAAGDVPANGDGLRLLSPFAAPSWEVSAATADVPAPTCTLYAGAVISFVQGTPEPAAIAFTRRDTQPGVLVVSSDAILRAVGDPAAAVRTGARLWLSVARRVDQGRGDPACGSPATAIQLDALEPEVPLPAVAGIQNPEVLLNSDETGASCWRLAPLREDNRVVVVRTTINQREYLEESLDAFSLFGTQRILTPLLETAAHRLPDPTSMTCTATFREAGPTPTPPRQSCVDMLVGTAPRSIHLSHEFSTVRVHVLSLGERECPATLDPTAVQTPVTSASSLPLCFYGPAPAGPSPAGSALPLLAAGPLAAALGELVVQVCDGTGHCLPQITRLGQSRVDLNILGRATDLHLIVTNQPEARRISHAHVELNFDALRIAPDLAPGAGISVPDLSWLPESDLGVFFDPQQSQELSNRLCVKNLFRPGTGNIAAGATLPASFLAAEFSGPALANLYIASTGWRINNDGMACPTGASVHSTQAGADQNAITTALRSAYSDAHEIVLTIRLGDSAIRSLSFRDRVEIDGFEVRRQRGDSGVGSVATTFSTARNSLLDDGFLCIRSDERLPQGIGFSPGDVAIGAAGVPLIEFRTNQNTGVATFTFVSDLNRENRAPYRYCVRYSSEAQPPNSSVIQLVQTPSAASFNQAQIEFLRRVGNVARGTSWTARGCGSDYTRECGTLTRVIGSVRTIFTGVPFFDRFAQLSQVSAGPVVLLVPFFAAPPNGGVRVDGGRQFSVFTRVAFELSFLDTAVDVGRNVGFSFRLGPAVGFGVAYVNGSPPPQDSAAFSLFAGCFAAGTFRFGPLGTISLGTSLDAVVEPLRPGLADAVARTTYFAWGGFLNIGLNLNAR